MRQASTVGWGQGPSGKGSLNGQGHGPGAPASGRWMESDRLCTQVRPKWPGWQGQQVGVAPEFCGQVPACGRHAPMSLAFLCGRRLLWVGGAHCAPGEEVQGSCAHTIFA